MDITAQTTSQREVLGLNRQACSAHPRALVPENSFPGAQATFTDSDYLFSPEEHGFGVRLLTAPKRPPLFPLTDLV